MNFKEQYLYFRKRKLIKIGEITLWEHVTTKEVAYSVDVPYLENNQWVPLAKFPQYKNQGA